MTITQRMKWVGCFKNPSSGAANRELGEAPDIGIKSMQMGRWARWALAAAVLLGGMGVPPGVVWAADVDVQVSSFTDSPDPAIRGGQITYTTVLKNGGPTVATNVVVTWPVPVTTTFVSVTDGGGGGTCVHNGANPGEVTCTYASVALDANSADWKTIALVVQTTPTTPASINASATATQTGNNDTNGTNNALPQTTTVNNGADLSFAISGAANPSVGAGNVTWSITGSNLGPDTSGPITVTVPIPATLTYESGSGTGWSCGYSAPNAVCTRAALASGAAYPTLSIVTKITSQIASGTLTVGGSIAETMVGDPVTSNNSATASVLVNPGLDLQITQDVPSPISANAGMPMTFVLRPTNLGPYPANTGANVSFPLPAGFTLTGASGTNGWTCSQAGNPIIVTCNSNGNFASGATSAITIVAGTPATVTGSTQYILTGTVAVNTGGPTDQIASNNTAARTVTVVPVGLDLSLTKTKTPAIVAAGANITSTIVVRSAVGGMQAASGTITVVDVLDPAKETYVSGTGTNWVCVEAPVSTVTCTYNATLNGGANALPLTITTQAVAAGTATNNATAGYSGTPGDYNSANNTIGASVTVTAVVNSPDLIAGITVTTPGGTATTLEVTESTVTYVATLTNTLATPVPAVDTRMTLTIPGLVPGSTAIGVITVNVPVSSTATYACTPAAPVTLTSSTIVCNQTGGTLTAGDVVTFSVPISRGLLDGTFTNGVDVAVTSTTQGDPTPANNVAKATVIIDPIADIELVSKNITSANPAIAGTNVTYVVTIRNNGPSSAVGVALSDVFTIAGGDAGFTFISASASNGGTCSGLIVNTNYPPGTPTLNCSWGSVVNSASTRTVTVVVRPNWMATPPSPRQLGNVASVTTTTAENTAGTDNGNNTKPATLTINPAQLDALINNADIFDPLGFDSAAAPIGATLITNDIIYDVAVTNNGPSLASGLGFTYTMTPPAGKTIVFRGDGAANTVASSNPSGMITGSICTPSPTNTVTGVMMTLTCVFTGSEAQLTNGTTAHRYLVFRVGTSPVTGGDTYNTNATVITNETDSLAANNSEAETTTVRRRVDLTIAKTPSLATVQMRQPFNWTITLTNTGPGDSDVTTLTDTLPAGMGFSGPAPSFTTTGTPAKNGNCVIVGQVMTCNISTGSGAPFVLNEVATVTVPVRMTAYPTVPSAGTARNCASATTDQVDPTSSNNTTVCSDVAVQRSSIAGRVFNDPDRNGIYVSAGTEVGLNGWSLALTGTDIFGNTVNLTQITAGSGATIGNYLFNDLSPADATGYVLTQTQLATHVNGPTDPTTHVLSAPTAAGDQGAYSGGALSGNTTYTAIKLAGNQTGTNYNFPEVRRPSLSGVVYVDVNNNDIYLSSIDTNISGATVVLRNAGDLTNVVATTTTAANGTYSFTNLDPLITYVLEEPLPTTPAGLANRPTAVNVGTVNAVVTGTAQPNTPAASTDRITGIVLSSGIDGINYNFGESQVAGISGKVFLDRDRSGAQNGTEPGITTVSVGLYAAGTVCTSPSTPLQTVSTDGSGNYVFATVTANIDYVICETQSVGYADSPPKPGTGNTTTAANQINVFNLPLAGSPNNNFPEVLGSISGVVYVDFSATVATNNNGVKNAGEPVLGSPTAAAGVPVTLTGTPSAGPSSGSPISPVTVYTAADGSYDLGDLYPGSYTVTEGAVPAALGVYNDGINTAGTVSGGGTPGVAGAVGVNTISTIVLAAGAQSINNNFAELPNVGISGFVYLDANENNLLDPVPTDGRIGDVTLSLYLGTSCSGTALATTVSNATDGSYTFSTVSAGLIYTVCETQPAGYQEGVVHPGTNGALAAATPNAITVTNLPSTGSSANNFGERVGIDLVVSKTHTPTVFVTNNTGSYTLRVKNIGLQASSGAYTVTDNLPAGMRLAQPATGTGWTCPGAVGDAVVTCTRSDSIPAGGESNPITVQVTVPAALAALPQPVYNVVYVEGGGEPDQKKPTPAEKVANPSTLLNCDPAITQNICRDPTTVALSASLSGTVWYDIGSQTRILDGSDRRLPGWIVEVLDATNAVIGTATTGSNGTYSINQLAPGVPLSVRFREPLSNVTWGYPVNGEQVPNAPAPCDQTTAIAAGTASSCIVLAPNSQLAIVLQPGANLAEQSLPVDPSGVVYDSVTRLPVPGSVVTLAPVGVCIGWNPATAIVGAGAGGYTIAGDSISMTVGADGFYQYLFVPNASAPASCNFGLTVTPPATHRFVSSVVAPQPGTLSPPGGPGAVFLVQPQAIAPKGSVGTPTQYFLTFTGGNGVSGVVHNHIPLDPATLPRLVLTKTGDKRVAEVGDTVVYTLTARLISGAALPQVTLRDRLPAGFTLIRGTVQQRTNGGAWGAAANPSGNLGPVLGFNVGAMGSATEISLQYRVRVGVGAMQGTGINLAKAHGCGAVVGCLDPASLLPLSGTVDSNEGQHKVVVTGGVFSDDACLLGKVFVDCNNNHIQDQEELGIPGVRLYFSDGHFVVTDSEGKYNRCGILPRSHVLSVDPSTLPKGSRLTTSSNRNLGDADSLFLDMKNGELHRGDFIEGSCSNPVLEQVKARRSQGEVRSVETERPAGPALSFESKPRSSPQQGTDSANQPLVQPRTGASDAR